jgi:hypothetical protein
MFLATRDKSGIYKFIIEACKKNCENLTKKKSELSIFERKLPSFHFFCFFLYILFSGKIFKKKRAEIKYNNIELIKFALSASYYNLETYTNKLIFYKLLIKKIILAGSLINACNYYFNKYKINGVYIDHCPYINGIIFSFFSQKRIPIYTNNYPYGIYLVNYERINSKYLQRYENTLKIKFKKKISNLEKLKAKKKISKLTKTKNFIPWLSKTKFKKFKDLNYNKFDYIIYPQAFTDAQMFYGNDSFETNLEWLEFTLNKLIQTTKQILIKPHPNYYNNKISEYSAIDKKIFDIVVEKYKNYKNLFFLREPLHNYALLKKLNKNCIALMQNSSVLMETAYMNFKSISSESIYFSKNYQISNMWKDKEQYSKLLNTDYKKLKKPKKTDLLKIIYILFFINNSSYNTNHWYHNIIKKYFKLSKKRFDYLFNYKARSQISNLKLSNINKLINKNNNELIDKISQNIFNLKN